MSMQQLSRRKWLAGAGSALVLGTALMRSPAVRAAQPDLADLKSITGHLKPISTEERAARIRAAQALMRKNGIGAIFVEPGSSLVYFSGVNWWRSERLTALILPAEGQACIVTPFFESPSIAQMLDIPAEIRVWQEDDDPLKVAAGFLRDRGLTSQPVGIEETVRFFAIEGLKKNLPDVTLVSANPVVRGCRMIKTPAELALMQAANDVTVAAYRWVYPRVEKGMSQADLAGMIEAASLRLGGEKPGSLILIGEGSAYPHGSIIPETVGDGRVVLFDCGCSVHGYASDISRSFVFGTPTALQRKVWKEMAQGQQVAMAAAKLGTPAGEVDDAVRAFYESLGYGPLYKLPGLSHRTGHGIGMDGHEPINLVRGETTPLAEGMCFSNEPGLYLPGYFGMRLEDCFHMTAAGPKFFTTPPTSIEHPFG